jgi:integrase
VTDPVADYLRQLANEGRKSAATLRAYGGDLRDFAAWLAANGRGVEQTGRFELRRYLVELEQQGLVATSVQRKLASLRGLFGWLQRQGRIGKDPAKLLKGPRAIKRVPRFLTTAEVDALLGQPFDDTAFGRRDQALLETLYSTGCRVSEVAGMALADLDLDEGIVRVLGKGRQAGVRRDRRVAAAPPRTRAREPAQRPGFGVGQPLRPAAERPLGVRHRRRARAASRAADVADAARPAPLVRHPPARPRRRPAHGAGTARPRPAGHDRDLHARVDRPPARRLRQGPPARTRTRRGLTARRAGCRRALARPRRGAQSLRNNRFLRLCVAALAAKRGNLRARILISSRALRA